VQNAPEEKAVKAQQGSRSEEKLLAQSEQVTQTPKQAPKSIHHSEPLALPIVPPVKVDTQRELRDLREMISLSDRKKIIKRIFKGNEENYERAITALNQKKTWREASLYLDQEVFKRYNVDEYSMEAVRLTDTVFERHFNKN